MQVSDKIRELEGEGASFYATLASIYIDQQQLEKAKAAAQPKDIADIIVCEPVTIRVKPVEKK